MQILTHEDNIRDTVTQRADCHVKVEAEIVEMNLKQRRPKFAVSATRI